MNDGLFFFFQFLDLTDKNTFRDFSKPMGAQGPSRLKNYRKRFKEWEDPTGWYLFL